MSALGSSWFQRLQPKVDFKRGFAEMADPHSLADCEKAGISGHCLLNGSEDNSAECNGQKHEDKTQGVLRECDDGKQCIDCFNIDRSQGLQKRRRRGGHSKEFLGDRDIEKGEFTQEATTRSLNVGFRPWVRIQSKDTKSVRVTDEERIEANRSVSLSDALADSERIGTRRNKQDSNHSGTRNHNAIVWFKPHGSWGKPPLPPPRLGTLAHCKVPTASSYLVQRFTEIDSLSRQPLSDVEVAECSVSQGSRHHSEVFSKKLTANSTLFGKDTSINSHDREKKGTSLITSSCPKHDFGEPSQNFSRKQPTPVGETNPLATLISPISAATDVETEHHRVTSEKTLFNADELSVQKFFLSGREQVQKSLSPVNNPQDVRQWQVVGKELVRATDSLPDEFQGRMEANFEMVATNMVTFGLTSQPSPSYLKPQLQKPLEQLESSQVAGPVLKRSMGEQTCDTTQHGPLKPEGSSFELVSESSLEPAKLSSAGVGTLDPPPSVSSTMIFPWEIFIAGTSKKAHEMFVELYNKAPDELKNQKKTSVVSKDNTHWSLSGQAAVNSIVQGRPDSQSTKCQQPGNMQSMENANDVDRKFAHNCHAFEMDVKALSSNFTGRDQCPSGEQGTSCMPQDEKARNLTTKGSCSQTGHRSLEGEGNPLPKAYRHTSGLVDDFDTCFGVQGWETCQSAKGHLEYADGTSKNQQVKMVQLQPHEAHLRVAQEGVKDTRYDNCQVSWLKSDKSIRGGFKVLRAGGGMDNRFLGGRDLQYMIARMSTGASKSVEFTLSKFPGGATNLDDVEQCASSPAKRPRQVFEENVVSSCATSMVGKGSADQSRRSSFKPHIWLRRWRPSSKNCTSSVAALPEDTECGLHDISQGEKGQMSEQICANSSKVLASAAAMAIVGTAARQFHSAQPQRKGSLKFWPAFGRAANQNHLRDHKKE